MRAYRYGTCTCTNHTRSHPRALRYQHLIRLAHSSRQNAGKMGTTCHTNNTFPTSFTNRTNSFLEIGSVRLPEVTGFPQWFSIDRLLLCDLRRCAACPSATMGNNKSRNFVAGTFSRVFTIFLSREKFEETCF